MDLPQATPNDSLEALSLIKFRMLFDPDKFLLRPENEKDKGIDFTIEIIYENRYTNFRCVVQIKARSSVEFNKDGTLSQNLMASNVGYMLNSGLHGFYFVYVKDIDTFYYEDLSLILKHLNEKDDKWINQPNHTFNFKKVFDSSTSRQLFDTILKTGRKKRELIERIYTHSWSEDDKSKIVIDKEMNVSSDKDVRDLIEDGGFILVNDGRWMDIIQLHNRASNSVASSAKYNLVLGIAHYYAGNLFDSLSFLKSASTSKNELSVSLQNYLKFIDSTVKYSVGLLTDFEYSKIAKDLEDDPFIGVDAKLEEAKRAFLSGTDIDPNERYEIYKKRIEEIIRSDTNVNLGSILNARCELSLIEGHQMNSFYASSMANLNSLLGSDLHPFFKEQVKKSTEANYDRWLKRIADIKIEAVNNKFTFVYFITVTYEVIILYEFYVFQQAIPLMSEKGPLRIKSTELNMRINHLIQSIDEAIVYFSSIGHINNQITALKTKYELLHFNNQIPESQEILQVLDGLIQLYDLKDVKRKYEFLKEEGTAHERLNKQLGKITEDTIRDQTEFMNLRSEMIRMDEEEKRIPIEIVDLLNIQLHPIGSFQFPEGKTNVVFDILNIHDNQIKQTFISMWNSTVTPIVNLYSNPITGEGLDGLVSSRDIEIWRNIHRIRKAFYENGFKRFDENI